MTLNIALIKPPQETNEVQPPLGLGYLASSVKDLANVKIIDSIKDQLTSIDVIKILNKQKLDIIGLQCYTVDFNTVKFIIKKIKQILPKTIVIVGGPHPTLAPIDTLNNLEADYAFLGDSEISFAKFVEFLDKKKLNKTNLKKISGFAYRGGKNVKVNLIKYPENLDDYDPSWELYNFQDYPLAPHGAFCKQFPVAPIIITRGCPFNCTYCGGPKISGRKIRSHSVDYVINQIEFLVKNYGVREIHIEDDNFTMNRKFVEDFCNKLISKNFGITWTCPNGIRLDTLDESLIKLMKKSGLYSISVGIESGSDKIRKLMRKNLNTKTIEEKIRLIKKCGIENITGFLIVGYPGETPEDIKRTINLSLKLPLTRATFSAFKPFPGTDAYDELVKNKELKGLDYSNFSLDKIAWSPKGISIKQLKNLRRQAFLRFYFRPKIIFRMLKDIKNLENLKFILVRIYRWILK
jgi:anaerobic magnesium-protoporphyrin IX monomethyl ester cyclase